MGSACSAVCNKLISKKDSTIQIGIIGPQNSGKSSVTDCIIQAGAPSLCEFDSTLGMSEYDVMFRQEKVVLKDLGGNA